MASRSSLSADCWSIDDLEHVGLRNMRKSLRPLDFDAVERKVGALEQFVRLDAVFRRQRNPDRGADFHLLSR